MQHCLGMELDQLRIAVWQPNQKWASSAKRSKIDKSPRTLGSNVRLCTHPSIDFDDKSKLVAPAGVRTGFSDGFEQLTLDWTPRVLTVRVPLRYGFFGN